MKLYMYNEEEAQKHNCKDISNKIIKKFMLPYFTVVFGIFIAIFVHILMPRNNFILRLLSLTPFAVWFIISVWLFKRSLHFLRLNSWSAQTAFIKDDDTLWAVKLTYIHFPVFQINDNLVTTIITTPGAVDSAIRNQRMHKEMQERKIHPESYCDALLDAKGKAKIMKDLDNNFTFVFNGREAVIRLDDIKFIGETDKTEIYTYKNYKGKTTKLEIIKAYPGFRDEVINSKFKQFEKPFPEKFKEKISENAWYVFLILLGIFVGIPLTIIIIGFLFNI